MLFVYTAKTYDGDIARGEFDASDENQAVKILKEKNLIVLDLKTSKKSSFQIIFSASVPVKDKLILVKQLSVMLESGLPLIEALENLKENTLNPELVKVVSSLSIDVRGGKSFSESLSKYPKVFPKMFTSIVNSGEKSGKLDKTLARLAIQMEKDYEFQSKIKNALMYPIVILSALGGVLILAVVFIIPQIKKIFDEMDVKLPIITRILLGVSDFILRFWWLFILIVIAIYILIKIFTKTKQFKVGWDNLKLKTPIFGPFIKQIYMARFLRNMQTLISAGLPITDSLKISKDVINNSVYQDALDRIEKKVEEGEQLAVAIKKEKSFPPMVAQMISIGEKSGKIDNILETLSNYFDLEVENITRNLTTILEPVLTILMGVGIALVVAAVIMPIYGLVNVI